MSKATLTFGTTILEFDLPQALALSGLMTPDMQAAFVRAVQDCAQQNLSAFTEDQQHCAYINGVVEEIRQTLAQPLRPLKY